MKFLVVLLVVGVGLWLMLTRSRARRGRFRRPADAARSGAPQAMLECAHCGLHLPAADAVLEGSHVYCSQAHRQLGPRRADAR
jgi:uncharacterized protein